MKSLRILAFILALVMVFCVACSGEPGDGEEGAEAGAEGEEGEEIIVLHIVDYTDLSDVEMVEANRAADWTLSEELVTLRVMIGNAAYHPEDMNELHIVQFAEERTNVRVDWIMPGNEFAERIALALAGGDMPDVVFGGLTNEQAERYGANGTLASIEYLMETYPYAAPNIALLFETHPRAKALSKAPDGRIYSVPKINDYSQKMQETNLIINQVWLDALGLEMPGTVDELKDVLIAFKDGDPNDNGKADEIPYLVNLSGDYQSWQGLSFLLGSFHAFPANEYRILIDGKPVNTATTDGWKRGVTYLHELYAEGLLNENVFTINEKEYAALLTKKVSVVGVAQVEDITRQAYVVNNPNTFSYLPPLKGPNGQEPWTYKLHDSGWERGGAYIWNGTENPQIALAWLDYLYDPINSLEMAEGEFYERIAYEELVEDEDGEEEGGYFYISNPPSKEISYEQHRRENTLGNSGTWAVFKDTYERLIMPSTPSAKDEFNAEYCAPYYVEPYPPVFYTHGEAETMEILNAAIKAEIHKQSREWIINGGAEEGWEDYLIRLDAVGFQEWKKVVNDAFSRYR